MGYYLLGHPLAHSFSPRLHALLGNPDYQLMDLDAQERAGMESEHIAAIRQFLEEASSPAAEDGKQTL